RFRASRRFSFPIGRLRPRTAAARSGFRLLGPARPGLGFQRNDAGGFLKPEPGVDRSNSLADASRIREWVERAQRGDEHAFEQLVDYFKDRAYGLALRILRSPADAEEAASDGFVRAWAALPRFRGESSFSTWLYRIVARCSFDRAAVLRSRRGREAPADAAP